MNFITVAKLKLDPSASQPGIIYMMRALLIAAGIAIVAAPVSAKSAFDGAECYITSIDSVANVSDYMIGPWATLADCEAELNIKRLAESQGWDPASMIPPSSQLQTAPESGEGRTSNAVYEDGTSTSAGKPGDRAKRP